MQSCSGAPAAYSPSRLSNRPTDRPTRPTQGSPSRCRCPQAQIIVALLVPSRQNGCEVIGGHARMEMEMAAVTCPWGWGRHWWPATTIGGLTALRRALPSRPAGPLGGPHSRAHKRPSRGWVRSGLQPPPWDGHCCIFKTERVSLTALLFAAAGRRGALFVRPVKA
ncbi:hypothetical protein PLESTB_001982600 [Pleodorina starrii]|uniref:Uncharacterized protein n=1 Tax=Pleodorina starrii TaxID=330485 RepID=A0A9W6FBA3_9CHLO|nr:hypothetical protein PLESTB_001982600 [Pleodorina starrii]GLC77659.1 hypothetical protein PLESTF_001969100 [Pleodorina starrii]